MEELVSHLISYGMDPDKAKLAAADLLLKRQPAPVASYGPATTRGYAPPQRGVYERGYHDPGDPESKGVISPTEGYISTDKVLNSALAGYASLLGKQMENRLAVQSVVPNQAVQPDDSWASFSALKQQMGLK